MTFDSFFVNRAASDRGEGELNMNNIYGLKFVGVVDLVVSFSDSIQIYSFE